MPYAFSSPGANAPITPEYARTCPSGESYAGCCADAAPGESNKGTAIHGSQREGWVMARRRDTPAPSLFKELAQRAKQFVGAHAQAGDVRRGSSHFCFLSGHFSVSNKVGDHPRILTL